MIIYFNYFAIKFNILNVTNTTFIARPPKNDCF